MNLRAVSWRLAHLIVELMQDAPLNKKLLNIYFNALIDLDENEFPDDLSRDLKNIKSMFSAPQAVRFDKLTEAELISLASRIVLLQTEISYYAGLQAGQRPFSEHLFSGAEC
ncbi:hypothetical protein [Atlantibacter sp.]|uniref:hypothetical protein n=1 Tax=Atlantibacter sp. TaxID=1903473 RepID=UPI0028AC245B|nr:hypothetical protein [Atlantibacter sp.]